MRRWTPTILMATLILSLGLSSCAGLKKKRGNSYNSASNNFGSGDFSLELNGDSDSNKAGRLRTVYFSFNSAALNQESKNSLKASAEYLKDNTSIEIQIEGHCDERGGVQYNLALGERRAKIVEQYLTSLGLSSKRINTISLGKERPLSFGHDEESWSRNRRANFVITAK